MSNDFFDSVQNPIHYTDSKIECKDAIAEATKDLTGNEGWLVGNVIKYMWRWKKKNGLEDLKKARTYLGFLIDQLEKPQS